MADSKSQLAAHDALISAARRSSPELMSVDEKNMVNRKIKAGIPERFIGRGLDEYTTDRPGQERAARQVRGYIDNLPAVIAAGKCLMLLGSVGTGKTHLACSIVQAAIESGRRARYETVMNTIRRIRETWGRQSQETERQVLAELAGLDLLVMDEIGQQYGTDNEKVLLYDVINSRYEKRLPTVVVSNFNVDGVGDYLGERVIDRLRENGGSAIIFEWDSYRKKGEV
jgi:DNA replication protein DnaC